MTSEDKIFNKLVELDILKYEMADTPHQCRCCGSYSQPTFKLVFEEEGSKDIDDEQPYLYICGECYKEAINNTRSK